MKKLKYFLKSLFSRKCKYRNICGLYQNCPTCNGEDDFDYCGKYRELNE